MKHLRWWCQVIYKEGCAACKVRQLRYGFRMDPVGYKSERDKIFCDTKFSSAERLWILNSTHPIEIEYD